MTATRLSRVFGKTGVLSISLCLERKNLCVQNFVQKGANPIIYLTSRCADVSVSVEYLVHNAYVFSIIRAR